MASVSGDLVGFVCPICINNFETAELLVTHYATHKEDCLKPDITANSTLQRLNIGVSVKKLCNKVIELQSSVFDQIFGPSTTINKQSNIEAKTGTDLTFEGEIKQDKFKLVSRSHTDYLTEIRLAKINNNSKETDRILKNLNKYLRKEKIKYDDEAGKNSCSNCKNEFKFTQKTYHCKLAPCTNCSVFVDANFARLVVNNSEVHVTAVTKPKKTVKPLRHCENCNLLLKVIIARNADENPDIIQIYVEMQNLKRKLLQAIATYKMIRSIILVQIGKEKTLDDLSQSVVAKDDIGKRGKEIVLLGQRIAEIPVGAGSRQARIQTNILKATKDFVRVAVLETFHEELNKEYQSQDL